MAQVPNLQEMTVSAAVEPLPATCAQDANLSSALGSMREHHLHELAVVDAKGRLLGLISDETLLKRKRMPLQTSVGHIMLAPPRITTSDSLARGAEALLANGFRELPVLEEGSDRVAGQITRWRLLEILRKDPEVGALNAAQVMTPDPEVVKSTDTIDFALERMRQLDEPTIPVVDDAGNLTGVVGARDILRLYAGLTTQKRQPQRSANRKKGTQITVDSVMTTPAEEAPKNQSVTEVIDQMLSTKASSVVITDGSKPIGIVTKGDLVELIASYAPRKGVFIQVSGLEGHDPFIVEDVFSIVEPALVRLANHLDPLTFNLHVIEHHRSYGHRAEVRARLTTSRGLFTAADEGDDIMRATANVLDRLEKQITRDIDRKRPSPRKARAGLPPAGRAKVV